MTEYISRKLTLSPSQVKSLMMGKRVRITKDKLASEGSVQVLLTKTQVNRIDKCKASGVGLDLQFSQVQLRKNKVLGHGFMDTLKGFAGDVAKLGLDAGATALKEKALPALVDKANSALKDKVSKISGRGKSTGRAIRKGIEANQQAQSRPVVAPPGGMPIVEGEGFWGDVGSFAGDTLKGVRDASLAGLSQGIATRIGGRGAGKKKGVRPKKGKGVVLPGSSGNGFGFSTPFAQMGINW